MYFLVEKGFHHVGQAGLELLTSDDLLVLATKVLGLQESVITPGPGTTVPILQSFMLPLKLIKTYIKKPVN